MFKKLLPYLLLALFTIPLILPLLRPGFFVTDDGDWMIIRLSAFHETLKTGQFPVRFLERLNHGYGYPVLNFLYPLPFYLGEAIHLLGVSFVDTVKLLFAASFLLGSWAAFSWLKDKFSTPAAIFGALLYTFAPYRIYDIYVRGSLGEATAFIFIPLVFKFFNRNLSLASLSLAALITSHNSLAFMVLPLFVAYGILTNPRQLIKTLLLAFGLSAFFTLPAIFELSLTRALSVNVANYSDYFLTSTNLLSLTSPIFIVIFLASLLFGIKKRDHLALLFSLFFAGSLFLLVSSSAILWQIFPLPALVQFPWRFLALVTLTGSFLGSWLIQKTKPLLLQVVIATLATVILILASLSSLEVRFVDRPEGYYVTNDDTTTVKNEYMPRWVVADPASLPDQPFEILESTSTSIKLRLNKIYYPGLRVFVDGHEIPFEYQSTGFPIFTTSPGLINVQNKFTETPFRLAADLISLGSLVLIVLLLTRKIRLSR